MSEGSQFLLPGRGRRRIAETNFPEVLLEFLPYAAILIDIQSQRILLANLQAAELTSYARSELTGINLKTIFPGWDENHLNWQNAAPPSSTDKSHLLDLIKRNQVKTSVQLVCAPLQLQEGRALIILETVEAAGLPLHRFQRSSQLWEGLVALLAAAQSPDLTTAMQLTLQAGSNLTGASLLAVYQAQESGPRLSRLAGLGDVCLLPERLAAQELIDLRKPQQWTHGSRPVSELQRSARAAGLSFLATAPLGQPNAIIGLVAIADERPLSAESKGLPETLPQTALLLATAITTLIQQYAWKNSIQTELQSLQAKLKLHSTLEGQLSEGLIVLDQELKIVRMNTAASAILGYTPLEAIGQPIENILIGSEAIPSALSAAQQGLPTFQLEDARLYRRNGEVFLALVRLFPVQSRGSFQEIILLFQDLNEREQIRLHAQQLEQRALLGEVTAVFAHEVRNPINNISTGLQLMALNLPHDDSNQEQITRMLQDCDRLDQLIKTVLAFSRPAEYEMEDLDLSVLLGHLMDRLRPRIADLNIETSIQIEPNCPRVRGNLRALEQVFSNLINNSVQAMTKTGGRLALRVQSVQTSEGGHYLEVVVADTGPGIPADIQERIFQPFFTTQPGGTGLGLAIAKRIITVHKGNIRLESFPGGTVFFVQLPPSPKPA